MSEADSSQTTGTTRRTVLRIAGHTAWAAPVIAVATAAPAFAVGSPVGSLVVSTATYNAGILGLVAPSMSFAVTNNGTVPINAPITLTINIGALSLSALPGISGSGWSITSSLLQLANLGTITLSYNGSLAPGATTPTVTLSFLLGLTLGSNRSATATGVDIYGHQITSPTKTF